MTGTDTSQASTTPFAEKHHKGFWSAFWPTECIHPKTFVNKETGELRVFPCKTYHCVGCVPTLIKEIGRFIAIAKPTAFLRVSFASDEWKANQATMERLRSRLRYSMRKSGRELPEWAWHIERDPSGKGAHAHIWMRGSYLDQAHLQVLTMKVGVRTPPFIKKVRFAGTMTYGMETISDEASLIDYLAMNNGHLVHSSRHFFVNDFGRTTSLRRLLRPWTDDQRNSKWRPVRFDSRPNGDGGSTKSTNTRI